MQAVILAGGLGSRLGALTALIPKPLLPVGGRPFLDYLITKVKSSGATEILILAGYLGDRFRDHYAGQAGIKVIIEPTPLGTGGALSHVRHLLADEFMILNGDTFFNFDFKLLAQPLENGVLGRVALRRVLDVERFGTVIVKEGRIVSFGEKIGLGEGVINGGVYWLRRSCIPSREGAYSLERDLLPGIVISGHLEGREFSASFIDIGIPTSYEEAQKVCKHWNR
jgi:NDP-sugar pyrophosphorylase family protein